MDKIVIFGATGFVGASLVEALHGTEDLDILAVINRPGSAWRLTRLGVDIVQADLLNSSQVDSAISGCKYVVNCSRGNRDVMINGLSNILTACKKHNVSRIVHLSSVMAYGDPPLASSESDGRQAIPKLSYGGIKNEQDQMIEKSSGGNLSTTILVPPNISGPHSYFLLGLVDALKKRQFVYLDDGSSPCQLVDITNLTHAIKLSIRSESPNGTYFINDGPPVSWRQVIESLQNILPDCYEVQSVSRKELADAFESILTTPKIRVSRSLLHLISSDMRQAIRKDPLWEKVDTGLRRVVARMGKGVERRIRSRVEGPIVVPKRGGLDEYHVPLCSQQLRDVVQSIDKATTELGYTPRVDFQGSMNAFKRWYESMNALDTSFAPLLRQL